MSEELIESIVESAACAATDGGFQAPRAVSAALRRGRAAARQGCCLPLPLLLDVAATLEAPDFAGRRTRQGCGGLRDYDAWLDSFCERALPLLEEMRFDPFQGDPELPEERGELALLMHVWYMAQTSMPALEQLGRTPEWARAYSELLTRKGEEERIRELWRAARRTEARAWTWWPGFGSLALADLRQAALWCRFSTAAAGDAPEHFEHAAGHLYMNAEPVPEPVDLAKRLQQLLRRREPIPVAETWALDEQDPWYGALPLSALVAEPLEEVIHRVVNHETARLNRPPPIRTPPTVHVHLCLRLGFASVDSHHDNVIGAFGRATRASTLQALALLLLDDWRELLDGVKLKFHLHVDGPEPVRLDVGGGGPRWWSTGEGSGPLPPARVVGAVLRRRTEVEAALADPSWRIASAEDAVRTAWWCGCVARCDLEEMGFAAPEASSPEEAAGALWIGDPGALPAELHHLVVVEPEGDAKICEVSRPRSSPHPRGADAAQKTPSAERVRLRASFTDAPGRNARDPSWRALRSQAQKLVLDVLLHHLTFARAA